MSTTENDTAGPAAQSSLLATFPSEPTAPPATDPAAGAGADAEQSPKLPNKPEPKLCGVCGTQPGKYKCPRCTMP
jgi:hypothetical protein